MKTITRVHFLILVMTFSIGTVSTSQAVPNNGGSTVRLECNLLGGKEIKQPKGSTITACCYDDGCTICDQNWENCSFDEAYKGGRQSNLRDRYKQKPPKFENTAPGKNNPSTLRDRKKRTMPKAGSISL